MRQHQTQRGAALATALVFLVAVTLLGLTSIRSSTVELRMAQNEQFRQDALQLAQASVDKVLSGPANTPTTLVPGNTICDTSDNLGTTYCASADPGLAAQFTEPLFTDNSYVHVTRNAPEFTSVARTEGTSSQHFKGALFGIVGGYDGSASGYGKAEVEQGLLRLIRQNSRVNN